MKELELNVRENWLAREKKVRL